MQRNFLQRDPATGYPIGADVVMRDAYGPIPDTNLFQENYGYEPAVKVHGWEWSVTFGRWTALVTMESGWHGWTYPKTF